MPATESFTTSLNTSRAIATNPTALRCYSSNAFHLSKILQELGQAARTGADRPSNVASTANGTARLQRPASEANPNRLPRIFEFCLRCSCRARKLPVKVGGNTKQCHVEYLIHIDSLSLRCIFSLSDHYHWSPELLTYLCQ